MKNYQYYYLVIKKLSKKPIKVNTKSGKFLYLKNVKIYLIYSILIIYCYNF